MSGRTIAALGAWAALAAAGCEVQETSAACDRTCLVEIAEDYLAALAAHDPSRAPLADELAFVENITRLTTGEGLWATAAGPATAFRIYVPDSVAGTIGLLTVIERATEHGVEPAQLAARLRIVERKITEAEHLVRRRRARGSARAPRGAAPRLSPPKCRKRERMSARGRSPRSRRRTTTRSSRATARSRRSPPTASGKKTASSRRATGSQPASFDSVDTSGRSPPAVARDCAGQMSSRRFAYIDSIDNRRVFAVDPVQGLAMGFSHFRQSMARGPQLMIAADGSRVMWEEKREPYDLPAAHIFKIASGRDPRGRGRRHLRCVRLADRVGVTRSAFLETFVAEPEGEFQ